MHRCIGFFSDVATGYRYSRQTMPAQPCPDFLRTLMDRINRDYGTRFNAILVNKYRNGQDSIGAHADDESALDARGVIAISLGAPRTFRIRHKASKAVLHEIVTKHGQLVFMEGQDFQRLLTHEIPPEPSISRPRISLTFRTHAVN